MGLQRQYDAQCDWCGHFHLGLPGTQKDAMKELRGLGWKIRRGKLVCPACLKKEFDEMVLGMSYKRMFLK